MYKVEKTSNPFTNIYFLIIVIIGAFLLVNLTLAVITIFFMLAQKKFREKLEEKKKQSAAEARRTYKISNFVAFGFQKILIPKDIPFSARFGKVYNKLIKNCHTQGFYEEMTDGTFNKIPKGSVLKEIQSNIPVHFQANKKSSNIPIDCSQDPEMAKLQKRRQQRRMSRSATTVAIQKMEERIDEDKDFQADQIFDQPKRDTVKVAIEESDAMTDSESGHEPDQMLAINNEKKEND
jgi:hypothetical protein